MIRYGRRAVRDLQAIKDYVEPLNPNATRRVFETIKSKIATLETFPQIGKIVDEHGTRRISAGRYPLRDILRNYGNVVVITHVRHTARELFNPTVTD
jgi:plasmid stabilization system protein ParE